MSGLLLFVYLRHGLKCMFFLTWPKLFCITICKHELYSGIQSVRIQCDNIIKQRKITYFNSKLFLFSIYIIVCDIKAVTDVLVTCCKIVRFYKVGALVFVSELLIALSLLAFSLNILNQNSHVKFFYSSYFDPPPPIDTATCSYSLYFVIMFWGDTAIRAQSF